MDQRLFVAINLDNATKLALAKIVAQLPNVPALNKTKIDNLHLTLQFLGDVAEELIPEIQNIINRIATSHSVFELNFTQLGAFPNWDQSKTIWIGIDSLPLLPLQTELARQLIKLVPIMDTKPFQPHLTLVRIKFPLMQSDIVKIQTIKQMNIPAIKITSIDLMASTLTPQGPIYTVLSKHYLE